MINPKIEEYVNPFSSKNIIVSDDGNVDNLFLDLSRNILLRYSHRPLSCSQDLEIFNHEINIILLEISNKYSLKSPMKLIKFRQEGIQVIFEIKILEIYRESASKLRDFYDKLDVEFYEQLKGIAIEFSFDSTQQ